MEQNTETKPVSIYKMPDGKKMIRVKTLDEDFLLYPEHIDKGREYEFDDAMKRLQELDLTTFNKKQALVMAAYHNEINKAIKVLDGDKLDSEWSVSEYNDCIAWYYYGNGSTVHNSRKFYTYQVRPVLAFPLERSFK